MVFKRRNPRSWLQLGQDTIWPKGGWSRAASYIWHRLRRLPDPPHRIARGVAAGVFLSFTPFFGFHVVLAILLALAIRGNVLAAALGTFVGNPLTFPLIAPASVKVGFWFLGTEGDLPLPSIVGGFSQATLELWSNFAAIFTSVPMHWDRFLVLFDRVFLPYLVGCVPLGLAAAVLTYMMTHRFISVYQRGRIGRLRKKAEKRRALAAARKEPG